MTSTSSPPTARVVTPYMSNAGSGTITSGRMALSPATVSRAAATIGHEDALVEAVGEHHLLARHTEVRRRLAFDVGVVGIERDVLAGQLLNARRARAASSRPCSRSGAAAGRPERRRAAGIRRSWHPRLDGSGVADRPSAVASATTVGAMARRPRAREALHRDDAHEVRRAQAAAEPRRVAGRQHVVRADRVVARDLRGVRCR